MEWLIGGLITVLIVGFVAVGHGLSQIARQLYEINITLAMMADRDQAD